MVRTISLMTVMTAMIAITPASAQAPETASPPAAAADPATTAAVVNAALDESDAPKPRTVRIAGKTVAVASLSSDESADAAPTPMKPKAVRARR